MLINRSREDLVRSIVQFALSDYPVHYLRALEFVRPFMTSSQMKQTIEQVTPHIASSYPGHMATAEQIIALAEEYRKAADCLKLLGRSGIPISWAPFRLISIHAIELFLNALLIKEGMEASAVRGLRHDLKQRAELAAGAGLKLRLKTATHLAALAGNREYLVTRYGAESTLKMSEINRLSATLEEVASKVLRLITPSPTVSSRSELLQAPIPTSS